MLYRRFLFSSKIYLKLFTISLSFSLETDGKLDSKNSIASPILSFGIFYVKEAQISCSCEDAYPLSQHHLANTLSICSLLENSTICYIALLSLMLHNSQGS